MQILLDNDDIVKKYKKDSARFILDKYNWDIVVDQMLRVYAGNVIDYNTVLQERKCNSREKV